MKKKSSRRDFLQKGACLLIAGGAAGFYSRLNAAGLFRDESLPNPKKLEYCGYSCPSDCQLYVASVENNDEKKREAYKLWGIREKYGMEFDGEKIFCYKCKTDGRPVGIVVEKCTVRQCCMAKGYDCCIQCKELTSCDKPLWKDYPGLYKEVIEMQKKYMEARG